jgi:hypothetical protein
MLAALAGLLVTDFQDEPGRLSGNRASPGTAIAAEAAGSSTTGITITRPVPSVMESLSDVQTRAPNLEEPAPRDRQIRRHRIPRSGDIGTFSPTLSLNLSPAAPIPAAPVSRAPALDDSFAGLGNPTSGDVIPPDTMGAAGPNHLVSVLNSQFGVFNKTGTLVGGSVVTLRAFWSSLDAATDNASVLAFDPKILYDTNSGRFIAVTLSAHDDAPPSWIMIAVSSTNDPTTPNTWVKVAIDADVDADNVVRNNWADFPGLGVDQNNIYVTANMFNTSGQFQYSKVWVVPIGQLLAGTPPDNTLTWTEIRQPSLSGDSLQPAHTFGAAPTEYFIREAGSGTLRLASVTGGTTWTDLGTISVDSFASLSLLPGAPQFGDLRTIDTSDTRLLNAVYRNGSLWTTHHVAVGGKIEVAWYQINPVNGVVQSQGRINDPTRGYFYPSIAVNANNDVAIGFSGSSAAQYASAYYTARSSTGPAAGVMQPPSLLKTGVASYFKTLTGTENRWGDFSATVVDPTDNVTFWTLQEYAETPRPSDGRSMWGTWWGRFQPPAIAAPTLTATAISLTQVDLAWTLPGGQSGFQVERRQLPGGDFGVISPGTLGDNITAYIDNTGAAGTTYSYRIRALNAGAGGDSYSTEATAVTASPPAAPAGGGGGGCAISNGTIDDGDVSPLATVLILLSPVGILVIRRHLMRNSR